MQEQAVPAQLLLDEPGQRPGIVRADDARPGLGHGRMGGEVHQVGDRPVLRIVDADDGKIFVPRLVVLAFTMSIAVQLHLGRGEDE